MQSIPNLTIPGSFVERNWGPGFSNIQTVPSAKASLTLIPGAMVKGKRSEDHPWSFTKIYRSFGDKNFWRHYYYPYGTSRTGPGAGGYPSAPVPTISAPDPYNKALSKIYEQVRGGMDLSVDLAEYRQTTRMISGASDQILGIARHLRSIGGISKLASNTWLQWQYGVRPLMSTISDLTGHQIELVMQPKHYIAYASSRANSRTSNVTISNVPGTHTQDASNRVRLKVKFSVSNAERYALSTYTSLSPLSILWELTPYSFVADWFVNVGGYLRMAETALLCGLECHGGTLTRTTLTKSHTRTVGYVPPYNEAYFDCEALTEVRTLDRSILAASMPMPQLPSLDVSLGSRRLLSAAALLRQILN